MTSIHKTLFNSYDQHFVTHESSDFTRKSRKLLDGVSFRDLKYSVGRYAVHAKKRDSIQQEIWARMILYKYLLL